jgi:hypothetical protein
MKTNAYKEKLQAMSDAELDREFDKVLTMRVQGYQMLRRDDPFTLLVEASVKLCDDAIKMIKEELKERKERL